MKSTRYAFGRALALLCTFVFISFGFISCQTETEHETELDVYQANGKVLTAKSTKFLQRLFPILTLPTAKLMTLTPETVLLSATPMKGRLPVTST